MQGLATIHQVLGVHVDMLKQERKYVTSTTRQKTIQNGVDSGWSPWSNGGWEKVLQTEVLHGDGYRDWRLRLRRHDTATSSLSAAGELINCPQNGEMSEFWHLDPDWGDQQWVYEAEGCFVGDNYTISQPDLLDYDLCVNDALMGFVSKAIRAQQDLQGLVVLGELKETIHMIHSPLSTLRNSLFGYFAHLKRAVKAPSFRMSSLTRNKVIRAVISDTYLEYQFGWKAMVNDIDHGLRALAHVVAYREPTRYVLGESIRQRLGQRYAGPVSAATGFVDTRLKTEHRTSVRVYGVIRCRPAGDVDHIRSSFGLTWPDIIPSLWELIPYSFVVDYFTNIGAIISAACFNTASVAWVNLGSSLTNSVSQIDQQYSPLPSPNGHQFIDSSTLVPSTGFHHEKFIKSRGPFIGSLIPSLEFTLPGFRQDFNLLALLGASRETSRFLARKGK
jgi:hypothetical protein